MKFIPDDLIDNRYQVIRELGSGGIGTVYLCQESELNRTVAVKIIDSDVFSKYVATDNDNLRRFAKEAQTLAKLLHPNVVQVYRFADLGDFGQAIVMEFVPGQSLRELIDQNGALPFKVIINISIALAKGLEHVHSVGIIHRDLKPENIIVFEQDGRYKAKLLDFGMAKFFEGAANSTQAKLTQTGMLIGTPAYMSPEHCKGSNLCPQSDIYSFGYILYEMLSGLPPFQCVNLPELFTKHCLDSVPDLGPFLNEVGLPPDMARMIKKCTEKNIQDRYVSFTDLLKDLSVFENMNSEKSLNVPEFYSETKNVGTKGFQHLAKILLCSLVLCLLISFFCFTLIFSPRARDVLTQSILSSLTPLDGKNLINTVLDRLISIEQYSTAAYFLIESTACNKVKSWPYNVQIVLLYENWKRLVKYISPELRNRISLEILILLGFQFAKAQNSNGDISDYDKNVLHEITSYLLTSCKDSSVWTKINNLLIKRVSVEGESQNLYSLRGKKLLDLYLLKSRSYFCKNPMPHGEDLRNALFDVLECADAARIFKKYNLARQQVDIALQISKRSNWKGLEANSHIILALVYLDENDFDKAKKELEIVENILVSGVSLGASASDDLGVLREKLKEFTK